jgi:hypothetical protein
MASIDIESESKENIPPIDEHVDVKHFQWFYERHFDKYFKFVKAKSEKSVIVRCLDCPPAKTLTVTVNSAYNLNIHVKVIFQLAKLLNC